MNNIKFNDLHDRFLELKKRPGLFRKAHGKFSLFLQQIESEWTKIIGILNEEKINYGMEIGTFGGGSFLTLCEVANNNAVLIAMDNVAKPYNDSELKKETLESFGKFNQQIYFYKGDSHEKVAVNWTQNILQNSQLDYLFIDGDHSYDGVKKDFNNFSPFVRQGGIIMLHDIAKGSGSDVMVFWNEIKNNYSYQEFIENNNQGWAGIGIIWK